MGGRDCWRTPPATLTFQDIDITVIQRFGAPWVSSADLARAFGYTSAQTVESLYRHTSDGFSASMSQSVRLSDRCGATRIFSLNGCHLMALIARTRRAMAFREWLVEWLMEGGADVASCPDTLTAARFRLIRKQIAAEFSASAEPGGAHTKEKDKSK